MGRTSLLVGLCAAAAASTHFSSEDFHLKRDRKSTRLNSSHSSISYAVFCLKKNTYTTIYTIVTLPTQLPLTLLLAAIIDSRPVFHCKFFHTDLYSPALTSLVVACTIFCLIL